MTEELEPVAILPADILEEINVISLFCADRIQGLESTEQRTKRTIQVLALGALWMKWMLQNPPEVRTSYLQIASTVASGIQGIPTN